MRNGDLAEVAAESIETRTWLLPDGTQANSVACLDSQGTVVGQFFVDQIAGWMLSVDDDLFDFDDDED